MKTLKLRGGLLANGDINLGGNNNFSVGSSSVRWKDLYVGPGTININDSVTGINASITVSNGVFLINNIAQAQLPNVKVTNLTFNDETLQTTAFGYHGSFRDYESQPNAGSTSDNRVLLRNTFSTNGITVKEESKIFVEHSGKYLFSFSGQFNNVGVGNASVTVWYSKNGTIVRDSSHICNIIDSTIVSIQDIVTLVAGDYIEFYWWASDRDVTLIRIPEGINPRRPASSSVSVSVCNV